MVGFSASSVGSASFPELFVVRRCVIHRGFVCVSECDASYGRRGHQNRTILRIMPENVRGEFSSRLLLVFFLFWETVLSAERRELNYKDT